MLEGEPRPAPEVAGGDKGRDLDDLAVAAGHWTRLAPGPDDVGARRPHVARLGRGEGQQGVVDGVHRNSVRCGGRRSGSALWDEGTVMDRRMRPPADGSLTPR